MLRKYVDFLDFNFEWCMLEFFLWAQCLEGANATYDQDIVIQDGDRSDTERAKAVEASAAAKASFSASPMVDVTLIY